MTSLYFWSVRIAMFGLAALSAISPTCGSRSGLEAPWWVSPPAFTPLTKDEAQRCQELFTQFHEFHNSVVERLGPKWRIKYDVIIPKEKCCDSLETIEITGNRLGSVLTWSMPQRFEYNLFSQLTETDIGLGCLLRLHMKWINSFIAAHTGNDTIDPIDMGADMIANGVTINRNLMECYNTLSEADGLSPRFRQVLPGEQITLEEQSHHKEELSHGMHAPRHGEERFPAFTSISDKEKLMCQELFTQFHEFHDSVVPRLGQQWRIQYNVLLPKHSHFVELIEIEGIRLGSALTLTMPHHFEFNFFSRLTENGIRLGSLLRLHMEWTNTFIHATDYMDMGADMYENGVTMNRNLMECYNTLSESDGLSLRFLQVPPEAQITVEPSIYAPELKHVLLDLFSPDDYDALHGEGELRGGSVSEAMQRERPQQCREAPSSEAGAAPQSEGTPQGGEARRDGQLSQTGVAQQRAGMPPEEGAIREGKAIRGGEARWGASPSQLGAAPQRGRTQRGGGGGGAPQGKPPIRGGKVSQGNAQPRGLAALPGGAAQQGLQLRAGRRPSLGNGPTQDMAYHQHQEEEQRHTEDKPSQDMEELCSDKEPSHEKEPNHEKGETSHHENDPILHKEEPNHDKNEPSHDEEPLPDKKKGRPEKQ